MRRFRQLLSKEETEAILTRNTVGVLSVLGDDEYPYGVPTSYLYHEGKLYFHTASQGHKMDSIRKHNKVSFTVVDIDHLTGKEAIELVMERNRKES